MGTSKRCARLADQVQIGHGGLHHDHVGALLQIELDFPHGLAAVGRVHLVAAAVAELGRGVGRLAERSVEDRGELGGVGKDGGALVAAGVQRPADGPHAAVHHVGGRHDVGARAGVRNGGLGQPLEGGVVIHVAVLDVAAVAVAGVFAIADVGDDQQALGLPADGADGALHDAVVVVGAGGHLVLEFRQAEQDHAADSQRLDFGALLDQLVDRHLVIAGHGADLAADALARADEQRQDELRRMRGGSRGPGRGWLPWTAGGGDGGWGTASPGL